MNRKIEIAFFIAAFSLLVIFLLQPERRNIAHLYLQKVFLYLNKKSLEVIYAKDFEFNDEVETYGVNAILASGDSGIILLNLEKGKYVLFFSVKKQIGKGRDPRFVAIFEDDIAANQEVRSEEWLYVQANIEIPELGSQKMKIFCQQKGHSSNIILSKVYIVKK